LKVATFAGGCFWCIEEVFCRLPVAEVLPGYSGGCVEEPTYEDVCSGETGHVEAVRVCYDPDVIPYREILIEFLTSIDPTDGKGQFSDRGSQYRPVIFYHDGEQRAIAERALRLLENSSIFSEPISVEVRPFENFYPAEDFHRKFYRKEPMRYYAYKSASGRESFCRVVWEMKGGKRFLEENL